MALTAYIRYDHNGRIVPGGPIVTKSKPAVGNWQVVTEGTNVTLVGQLRAFIKINEKAGGYVPGSLFLGHKKPATGRWIEVNATYSPTAQGLFLATESGNSLITEDNNNIII